jgi:ribosomal protein S18 acetylase RimI-like enzyme
MSSPAQIAISVRPLTPADVDRVCAIDALHTGVAKPDYWRRVFADFLSAESHRGAKVGLATTAAGDVAGYLLGEVRAFEFGSPPCGWVFAVGVAPEHSREGHASILLTEACRRFRAAGMDTVRTMVRRDDIPVLSFFRSRGFAGGAFYQLERGLEDADPALEGVSELAGLGQPAGSHR